MRSATQSCTALSRPAGVLSRSPMYRATDSMLVSTSAGIEATAGWSARGSGHAVAASVPVAPPGRVCGVGTRTAPEGAAVGAGVAEGVVVVAGGGSGSFWAKRSSWTAR